MRRHQKWLWIVISVFVIIAFVWYFNPDAQNSQGGGDSSGSEAVGSMYGRPVTRKQYSDAYREAQLRYFFSYGAWPQDDEFTRQNKPVEREALNRLVLGAKLKDFKINASDEAVADWITEAFKDKEGGFRKETYDNFIKQFLPKQGMRQADFERFARHEVAIQHLVSVAGIPGKLVPPQEAEASYRRENEQLETSVAVFAGSNYVSQVKMDPTALAVHYTNQASAYRLPERVEVLYVAFPASNYITQAEAKLTSTSNLTEQIEMAYQQRGATFYTDTNGQVLAPVAAKAKIRAEVKDRFALLEARRDAIQFSTELLEMNPPSANNLSALAGKKGLKTVMTKPFPQFDPPEELKVPAQFGRLAFGLTPEAPFSMEPVEGEDAIYVLGMGRKIPSELPPYELLQNRVADDYKRIQSQQMAREAGRAFAASVTNGLTAGKSFEDLATEARATVAKLPPFSLATESLPDADLKVELASIKNSATGLSPGKASAFGFTRDGGFVLFLKAKVPVADSKVQADLPAHVAKVRRTRQSEAFNDWFRQELKLANATIPGLEPTPEQP